MADRMAPFLRDGRGMFLAYDHGLEHGPTKDFDDRTVDPAYVMDVARKGRFTGVVFQYGVAAEYHDGSVPLVLKLNGKTALPKGEPISRQISTVEDAVHLGAKGVGYTVYMGSQHENVMLSEVAAIRREAHEAGLAVIGWIYPRGAAVPDDMAPDIVAWAARTGLELGLDAVKIKYSGTVDTFRWAVRAAKPARVFMSGGPKAATEDAFLQQVREVVQAGGVGVAVGRNIWQAKDPEGASKKLRDVVFAKGKGSK